jgi:hypothetical protein
MPHITTQQAEATMTFSEHRDLTVSFTRGELLAIERTLRDINFFSTSGHYVALKHISRALRPRSESNQIDRRDSEPSPADGREPVVTQVGG